MKKILSLSAALLLTISINAQSYLLSFNGTGGSTTVDSVKIENITQGKSLMMKGTDVLNLNIATGINQIKADGLKALKVYPNPSAEYATIEFYVPDAGISTICIYNQLGRKVAQSRIELSEGIYTYQLEGLEKGLYTIQVASQTNSYSGRILSYQKGQAIPEISCIKYVKADEPVNRLKNGSSSTMQYSAGDRLLFTGYSGTYITKGVYVISNNQTVSFNFIDCTDGNNHHYAVLPYKSKIWMAENLKTTAYNDGTPIPYLSDTTRKSPAYTWYTRADNSIEAKFGPLYNWLVVGTGKLCPSGWHVASDFEWNSLQSELSTNVAGKLKSTTDWAAPNYGATNETGFGALPGGMCDNSLIQITDKYKMFGTGGYWWTSTPIEGGDFAYYRAMSSESGNIFTYIYGEYRRSKYFSVRCVKN